MGLDAPELAGRGQRVHHVQADADAADAAGDGGDGHDGRLDVGVADGVASGEDESGHECLQGRVGWAARAVARALCVAGSSPTQKSTNE